MKNDIAVLIGTASQKTSIELRALSQFLENAVNRFKGSQTNFASKLVRHIASSLMSLYDEWLVIYRTMVAARADSHP